LAPAQALLQALAGTRQPGHDRADRDLGDIPAWGWGTEDSAQALSYLRRFGSVTVLNGHIHQTTQKVEGNITFHTATSTAFPQPKPGAAPSPGPMKVPADKLRGLLGITSVHYVPGRASLALVDSSLESPATG
jgi:3',5'-cyclic-AMP phosphodiesterase